MSSPFLLLLLCLCYVIFNLSRSLHAYVLPTHSIFFIFEFVCAYVFCIFIFTPPISRQMKKITLSSCTSTYTLYTYPQASSQIHIHNCIWLKCTMPQYCYRIKLLMNLNKPIRIEHIAKPFDTKCRMWARVCVCVLMCKYTQNC